MVAAGQVVAIDKWPLLAEREPHEGDRWTGEAEREGGRSAPEGDRAARAQIRRLRVE